ncbi:MAG TPA: ImmA/IrrE family metallo-endopeptidase [Candidatus Doudnabacteria bacterium]|nr:ImmA/IrrE family metallo-endopeptidase [Candidatus Doudnabacteria bacterium]
MNDELPDLGPRKKSAKILAQKLIKQAGVAGAPVSLQRVIECLQLTHDLEVRRIFTSDKVSGLLVVCREMDEEYSTIGFNANDSWYRRRFTIAHEIGHLLFGHACTKGQNSGTHNEREADIFAAELLMPTKLIKADFQSQPNLQQLSHLYRVSQQALTIKLMDCRLV